MKNGHTAVNEFLKKKERFADLFNASLFQGQQIINPEELELIKGESDILVEDKNQKVKNVHRFRDIAMRWRKKMVLAILATETQTDVHYAMPIRGMNYDSMSYLEQAKQLWESRNEKGENLSGAEYLSRFRKEDKLVPVITIVFYYGTAEWDASTDLYGMFEADVPERQLLEKYVSNYQINLIDVNSVDDIETFQTDLKQMFGIMKHRGDKKELVDYMRKNEKFFKHVDIDTYYAIGAFLNSKKILNAEVQRTEVEGETDMCKALEDLYREGEEKGRENALRGIIEKKLEKGYSISEIADILEEDESVIKSIIGA